MKKPHKKQEPVEEAWFLNEDSGVGVDQFHYTYKKNQTVYTNSGTIKAINVPTYTKYHKIRKIKNKENITTAITFQSNTYCVGDTVLVIKKSLCFSGKSEEGDIYTITHIENDDLCLVKSNGSSYIDTDRERINIIYSHGVIKKIDLKNENIDKI